MHRFRTRLALAAIVVAAAAGCGSEGVDTNTSTATTQPPNTTAAPARLSWEAYRGVRLPRSLTDGPTNGASPVDTGYSQTPQGAVLAAVRGQAELALARDNEFGKIAAIVTAPGPGRTEYVTSRAVLSVEGDLPAESVPKFLAFKVVSYRTTDTTLTAGVHVVLQTGTAAQLYAYPVALQWISGDWRIVLPTASDAVDAIELANLDGYTLLEGA